MNKLVKRISAILAMLMLVLTCMPEAALADNADEKVAIYMQVPSDWVNPCVWAWDEDGNNAFAAWPGGEAEAEPANEGWYYIHIPAWANHVIVNANEGSVQTGEQVLEGKNAWITVTDAENVAVSYEQQTKGDIPEYVEKFVVHAQVDASWENPCLWAWSAPDGKNAFEAWPGEAMVAGEDGWYTAKVPTWVNSIIVNANEGSVQTEDLSIDAAEIWVTVDAEGVADFSYVDPNKEEVPNVKVHVMAPSDWNAPCLWAWSAPDGTNVYTTWPGEALEAGENGWLTKEIPGWVNSVIVNGNEGGVQTTDISVETGKDIWIVVTGSESYEVTYEEPEVSAPETSEDTETVADTEDTTDAKEPSDNNAGLYIAIAVVVVVVIVVVVIVIKKKK